MKRKILLGFMGVLVAACGNTDSAGPSVSPLFGGNPPPPPPPTTYSGRATVLAARVVLLRASLGDTGALPSSGGSLQSSLLAIHVPGVLDAGAATAATQGGNREASSDASVADASLGVLGIGVSATLIASHTSARCEGSAPTVSGESELTNLTVSGVQVTVTGAPNQMILIPGGRIVINEQTQTAESITVSALHVVVNGLADVVVSQTHSDIHCGA